MTLSDTLRDAFENHLSDEEIERFEAGDLCIFVRTPKFAFFRYTGDGFQRADVSRTRSAPRDAEARIYHDVYRSTSGEVLSRVRNQDEVLALPVEVGFGADSESL